MKLNERIGFDLGWDFYACSLSLESQMLSNDERELMRPGHSEARRRHIKPHPSDRFDRKWLLLRRNAWRKNRTFDPAVTPAFLRAIDVPECPIAGIRLTHAGESGSNWSVDRINNHGGYSPGNLIVVSGLANMAKSNRSLDEITRIACGPEKDLPRKIDGSLLLTRMEWMRWRAIASQVETEDHNPEQLALHVAPAVCLPLPYVPINTSAMLQMAIGWAAINLPDQPLARMTVSFPKSHRVAVNHLVRQARREVTAGMSPADLWFSNSLFKEFSSLYQSMGAETLQAVEQGWTQTMARPNKAYPAATIELKNWNVLCQGYGEVARPAAHSRSHHHTHTPD